MLLQIGALRGADEHADAPVRLFRRTPGVLERVPGRRQQQAVLRIENRRLARWQTEKLSIEATQLRLLGHAPDIVGVGKLRGRDTGLGKLGVAERSDRFDPGAQVGPVLSKVACAGKNAGHADDRDVGCAIQTLPIRTLLSLPLFRSVSVISVHSVVRSGPDEMAGQRGDGRMGEDLDQRHLGAKHLAQARVHAQEQERVAAQVEKVVVDTDGAKPEQPSPDRRDLLLGCRACRHKGAVKQRPYPARRRQGAPIDLAGRGGGQAIEQNERRGNHEVRQAARQRGPQRADRQALAFGGHQVADQALALAFSVDGMYSGGGLFDRIEGTERSLDRRQLNPVAAHLHLLVAAAKVLKTAIRQQATEIAGQHGDARVAGRAGDERGTRQLVLAPIARRQISAAHSDLSDLAGGDRPAVVIENLHLGVVIRVADGNHLLAERPCAVDWVARDGERLAGGESVDQQAARRKMRTELLDVFAMEGIAAQEYEPRVGKVDAGIERVQEDAKQRHRQLEHGEALAPHPLGEIAGALGAGERQARAVEHSTENLRQRSREAHRKNQGEAVRGAERVTSDVAPDEVLERAVGVDDAFRRAGRARGVEDTGVRVGAGACRERCQRIVGASGCNRAEIEYAAAWLQLTT